LHAIAHLYKKQYTLVATKSGAGGQLENNNLHTNTQEQLKLCPPYAWQKGFGNQQYSSGKPSKMAGDPFSSKVVRNDQIFVL
jgi:hypothetical protein